MSKRERTSDNLMPPKKPCSTGKPPATPKLLKSPDNEVFRSPITSISPITRSNTAPKLNSPGFSSLKEFIKEQNVSLVSKMNIMESKFETKLDDTLSIIKDDLQTVKDEVNLVRENLSNRMDKFELQVNNLSHNVFMNREMIDRIPRMNSLTISGIPYAENENLQNYFEHICSALSINVPLVELKRFRARLRKPDVATASHSGHSSSDKMQVDN